MSSKRLPGKVMLPFGGSTVIGHLLQRLFNVSVRPEQVVCAVSDLPINDALVSFLKSIGIDVVKGPENNVLERFRMIASKYPTQNLIRLTADNPLISTRLIEICCLNHYSQTGFKFSSNRKIDNESNLVRWFPKVSL